MFFYTFSVSFLASIFDDAKYNVGRARCNAGRARCNVTRARCNVELGREGKGQEGKGKGWKREGQGRKAGIQAFSGGGGEGLPDLKGGTALECPPLGWVGW